MSATPRRTERGHVAGLQYHPLPATCAEPTTPHGHEGSRAKRASAIVPPPPTVELRRAAGISDHQAAVALHTCYGIILNAARRAQAAGLKGGAQ